MPEIPDLKYQLVSEIGQGSAGTVYATAGTGTGDRFAVKIFHRRTGREKLQVQAELRLLSRLRHPHIVPVLDFGVTTDHRLYWVMPLIEAIPLDTFRRTLTPERVKEYLVQACQALDYLHRSGVIHGDLKPDNILIEPGTGALDFQLRLVDFGMARMSGSGRNAGRGGSFPYMAPECLARERIDPRSDLFSLGVVLAELIHGEPPFNSPGEYRRLLQGTARVAGSYPAPFEHLGKIADQLTAADPDDRLLSALDVIHAADPGGGVPVRRGFLVPSRFTGRDKALQILTGMAAGFGESTRPGAGVFVDGGAGSGRSRLLREFTAHCRMNDVSSRYYRCIGGDPFEDVTACFGLESPARQAEAVEKCIREMPRDRGPVVLCVDDLHRADRNSRSILNHLVLNPPTGRLMVMAGNDGNPEDGMASEHRRIHRVALAPLSPEESRTLIRSRFVPEASDAVVDLVQQYGGRLPGSLNRCIDTFQRMGIIAFERDAWRQKQVPGTETTDGDAVDPVRWQMEDLETAGRQTLMEIACLGADVPLDMVSSVLKIPEIELVDMLEQLQGAGLVALDGGQITLCCPSVRTIALDTVTGERRKALHRAAADYLERIGRDPVGAGFHHLDAGDRDRGLAALFHGAVDTLRHGSIDAALALFDRMLREIDAAGEPVLTRKYRWKIGLERGNALIRSGDPEGALETFTAALEQTGDPAERCLIMGNIAMTRLRTGDTDGGLSVLKEAAQLAARAEQTAQHAVLQAQLGNLYTRKQQLNEAANAYRTALPLLEKTENHRVSAAVWNNLGSVREMLGDIDGAFTAYTRALPLKRRLGDRLGEAVLRHNIGHILVERGRIRAARVQLEKASRSLRDQGEAPHLIQFLGNLSLVALYSGQFGDAAKHLAEADPRLRELDDSDLLNWLLSIKGRLYTECGHPDVALKAMEPGRAALRDDTEPGRETLFFQARYLQAQAAAGIIDPELEDSLSRTGATVKDPLLRCEIHLAHVAVAMNHRRLDAAEQAARKAVAVAEANGLFFKKCMALARIAEILLLGGQPGQALSVLEPSDFIALEKAGARPLHARWTALSAAAYDKLGQRAAADHANARAREIVKELRETVPAEIDPDRFAVSILSPPASGTQASVTGTAEVQEPPPERPRPVDTPAAAGWGGPEPVDRMREMEDRRKLQLLLDISRGLNLESDLDVLLRRIVDHAIDLTGAERGFLYLKPGPEDEEIVVTRNILREAIFGSRAEISTSVLDEVMRTRQPVMLSDTLADEDFSSRRSILAHNLRTVMCAPLVNPFAGPGEGSPAVADGVLYVDGTAGRSVFSPLDREIFESLASHAAVGLANLRMKRRLNSENRSLKQQIRKHFSFDQLIGTSPAMLKLKSTLEKVAPSHAGVLILGESGTGKELVARTLHVNSPRENGPFLSINCAALAESVLESELFGVEAGVATGVKRRTGLFVQADGGTLFLDEIGDMPMSMQAKILRVLQERRVRPVGAAGSVAIDVRVVCATHRDLWQAVRDGAFREDLLFRLDVITLRLPPLRERIEDIPVLARFFVNRYARQMKIPAPGISLSALRDMARYPWPGNVRELENQIQRALVLSDLGRDILPEDLSPRVLGSETTGLPVPVSPGFPATEQVEAIQGADLPSGDMKAAVAALETRMIRDVLQQTGGNKTETARILGLSREGLRLKMQRLEIE